VIADRATHAGPPRSSLHEHPLPPLLSVMGIDTPTLVMHTLRLVHAPPSHSTEPAHADAALVSV
jgi:hypothetical protein